MHIHTLTIVGVGLIGGSIGMAAKRRGLVGRVLGAGRQQSSLDRALAVGAIDVGSLDQTNAVRQADIAVFCTPVDQIVEQVLASAPGCRPGTLLTDAGSTKATIVHGLESRMPSGVAFVGSHPLAGSEKRGPEHADADLFQDRLTIVARTSHTDAQALERTSDFWRALGSRVRIMDPVEHDRALAVTSHLPHMIASALAGILPSELRELTATGFRDTTRLAAGDPALWNGIFMQNCSTMLDAIKLFQDRLAVFQHALKTEDWAALNTLLTEAKRIRDALGSNNSSEGRE